MREYTMLDKASSDLKIAELIMVNYTGDEADLEQAGFHIQQSLEKLLKTGIQKYDHRIPKTNDIYQLLGYWRDIGLDYSNVLDVRANMITS